FVRGTLCRWPHAGRGDGTPHATIPGRLRPLEFVRRNLRRTCPRGTSAAPVDRDAVHRARGSGIQVRPGGRPLQTPGCESARLDVARPVRRGRRGFSLSPLALDSWRTRALTPW